LCERMNDSKRHQLDLKEIFGPFRLNFIGPEYHRRTVVMAIVTCYPAECDWSSFKFLHARPSLAGSIAASRGPHVPAA